MANYEHTETSQVAAASKLNKVPLQVIFGSTETVSCLLSAGLAISGTSKAFHLVRGAVHKAQPNGITHNAHQNERRAAGEENASTSQMKLIPSNKQLIK